MFFEGTLSRTAYNVTVNAGGRAVPDTVDACGTFRVKATVAAGAKTVTVQATNLANNQPVSKSF